MVWKTALLASNPASSSVLLWGSTIPTAWPTSPGAAAAPHARGQDNGQPGLNLQRLLVPHPGATLLLRVAGDSMRGAGIHHGDLLVVDRQLEPRAGLVVVALLDGGFTVKRLAGHGARQWLEAAHPAYPSLPLHHHDARIWGVATHVIRGC